MIQWPDLNLPPLNLWSLPQWMQDKMQYDHTELKKKWLDSGKTMAIEWLDEHSASKAWRECMQTPLFYDDIQYRERKASINEATSEEWDALVGTKSEKSPLNKQVSGDHYKNMVIQPVEFIQANKLGFIEGSVIKYVCRHKAKNGKQDLEKAKHFIDLLIALEYENVPE